MHPIQIEGIISSLSYCKDGGMRVGIHTQEMSIEEKTAIQDYFQKFGYILFKPNEFQEKDIPKNDAIKKGKSKAQIMRQHIWRYWKDSESKLTEEEFYQEMMDKLIKFIDRKINEL